MTRGEGGRVHPLAALGAALVDVLGAALADGDAGRDPERLGELKKRKGPDPAAEEGMLTTMEGPECLT